MASDDNSFDFSSNLFGGDLGLTVEDLNIDLNDIQAVSLNNHEGAENTSESLTEQQQQASDAVSLSEQLDNNTQHQMATSQNQVAQVDMTNFSNRSVGEESLHLAQQDVDASNQKISAFNQATNTVDVVTTAPSSSPTALNIGPGHTTNMFAAISQNNSATNATSSTSVDNTSSNLIGKTATASNSAAISDAEAQLRTSAASRLSPQQIPYLIARYRLEDQQSKKPNVSAEKKKEHIKNVETIKRLLVDFSKINPSAFYLAVKSLQANNNSNDSSSDTQSLSPDAIKTESSTTFTTKPKETSEMAIQLQKMQVYKSKISQELLAFNELKQKHTSCHANLAKFVQENPNFQENPNILSMHATLVKKEEDTRSGMIKLGEALKSSYAVYNTAKTAYQEAASKQQQQQEILAKHEEQVKMRPKTKQELNKIAKQKQLKEKQQQKELKQRQKKQLQLQRQQEKEMKQKLRLEQQQQKQLLKKQAAAIVLEKKKKAEQKAAAIKSITSDKTSNADQLGTDKKDDTGNNDDADSTEIASADVSSSEKADANSKAKKATGGIDIPSDDLSKSKSEEGKKDNTVKKEKTPKAKTPNAEGKSDKTDDDKKKKISKKQMKSAEEKRLAKEEKSKKNKEDLKSSEKNKTNKDEKATGKDNAEEQEEEEDEEEEEEEASPKSIYPPYNPKVPLYSKNKLINYLKNLTYEEKILMSSTANKIILDNDVELLLNELLKEFLDHVIDFSSKLAKHRNSEELSIKDLKLNLDRNWGIRVPGNVDPASSMLNMNVIENSRKRAFPPTETYIRKLRKIYKGDDDSSRK